MAKMPSSNDAQLATLKDFPHREDVPTSYYVDRSHWPTVKKLLKNPGHFCCGSEGRPINAVLRVIAMLAAIAALVISLVKDFMDKDDSLQLSTIELVCALLAVSSSIVKHGIEWRHIRKDLRSFERLQESKSVKCSKRCPGYFIGTLMAIWLFCTSLLLIGFVVFHRLDADEHSLMEYTKFSTAFTVFISWILDALVTEGLSEMTLNWTVDRCALLIHVIKEELYHELRCSGKEGRIDEIEKYIGADELFDVDRNRRILAKKREHHGYNENNKYTVDKHNTEADLKTITENHQQVPISDVIVNPPGIVQTKLENDRRDGCQPVDINEYSENTYL